MPPQHDFQTVPVELLLTVFAAALLAWGWRSFSVPARGVPVLLMTLPVLKTVAQAGATSRLALPDVFTFVIFVGTCVLLIRGKDPGWRSVRIPNQVLFGILAFLPAVLLSFVVAPLVGRSIIEFTAYAVNLVTFLLIIFHVRTREQLFRCLRAWEIGVVIAVAGSVVGVALVFLGILDLFFTEGPKVASTFKKSGQLSAYLLVSLPLLWFNFRELSPTRRSRRLRGLLIALTYFSILASGSRAGTVAGAGLLFLLFGAGWLRALGGRRAAALAVSAILLGFLIALPNLAGALESLPYTFQRAVSLAEGVGTLEDLSLTRYHQFLGWRIAAAEHPWTGLGAANFIVRATSLVPQAWVSHEIHNTYLGVWAETGLAGILALALFYLGVLRAGWQVLVRGEGAMQSLGLALVVALLTLFAYGTINFGLRMRHLWCAFGLTIAAWNVVTTFRMQRRETP